MELIVFSPTRPPVRFVVVVVTNALKRPSVEPSGTKGDPDRPTWVVEAFNGDAVLVLPFTITLGLEPTGQPVECITLCHRCLMQLADVACHPKPTDSKRPIAVVPD